MNEFLSRKYSHLFHLVFERQIFVIRQHWRYILVLIESQLNNQLHHLQKILDKKKFNSDCLFRFSYMTGIRLESEL